MSGTIFLFPGQGSQQAGMAEYLWEYPLARDTFAEASDHLGWDVGELCRFGTMEELTRTDRTQLTILVCSVAVWRMLEERGIRCSVAAGHSLGEYSALVATGCLSFADALTVVNARGRAMQACGEQCGGTMAAVLGMDADALDEVCAEVGDVWPANYNSPGQIVISGGDEAVRKAGELAVERGAKRAIALTVGGAFHTPFMAGAAESLSQALGSVTYTTGERGAFFSTTEVRYPEVGELAQVLAKQLMSPVRFTQSIEAIMAGENPPDRGIEIGPGNVLCGLVKRISRNLPVAPTGDSEALKKAIEANAAD